MNQQETLYSLQVKQESIKLARRYKYELAQDYEVSNTTFWRMLKDAGISIGRGRLTASKQLEIFNALGFPERYLQVA